MQTLEVAGEPNAETRIELLGMTDTRDAQALPSDPQPGPWPTTG